MNLYSLGRRRLLEARPLTDRILEIERYQMVQETDLVFLIKMKPNKEIEQSCL